MKIDNRPNPVIDVIIPAWNEEEAITLVIDGLPKNLIRQVIVCDNGSTDKTAQVAKSAGAVVISQPERGYGNACLAGIRYIQSFPTSERPEIIVFIDGDFSDYPEQLPMLIEPIVSEEIDMVIGSRSLGGMEPGAMTLPQRFGNWLAPWLINIFYGYQFTDLGPFRAIKWEKLMALNMQDKNFGWTVEMQVKAAKLKFRTKEIAVRYRRRAAGKSKVSGTIKGTIKAGWKIISVILIEKIKH